MFDGVHHCSSFRLNASDSTGLCLLGTQYECYTKIAEIHDRGATTANVVGNHGLGMENYDIRILNIYYQPLLAQFPRRVEAFFKRLLALQIFA